MASTSSDVGLVRSPKRTDIASVGKVDLRSTSNLSEGQRSQLLGNKESPTTRKVTT